MTKSKALLYLEHAPDYREAFLRELSEFFELTVVAQSCEADGLRAPTHRIGYRYIELNNTFGKSIRFNFQLPRIIKDVNPDIICVNLNLRHPIRVFNFIFKSKEKWIWWGQVYGRNKSPLLDNFKKYLIRNSAGALVYSDDIVAKLNMSNVKSFDNSQYSRKDYIQLENNIEKSVLKCLFVGRPQKRKRLELIINIAKKRKDLEFRLVGPSMEDFFKDTILPNNVELFPAASGNELQKHFKWCNIVVNPGHVGLLVMNSACHNRPIVIDSKVEHAPEVILAKEANQHFIDFLNEREINDFFDELIKNPNNIISKGEELYNYSINKYTIEEMALKHKIMFEEVINKVN